MNYYLWLNDEAKGPYTLGQLRALWNGGQLTGENLFSQDGCQEWHYLNEIIDRIEPPIVMSPVVVQLPAKKNKANIFLVLISTILVIGTILSTLVGIINLKGLDTGMSAKDFVVAGILFVISLISIGVTKIK